MSTQNITWGQQGWVCPKCGSVWAPHVDGCYKCNNTTPNTITIGDPPSTYPPEWSDISTGSGRFYEGQEITISDYEKYSKDAKDLSEFFGNTANIDEDKIKEFLISKNMK